MRNRKLALPVGLLGLGLLVGAPVVAPVVASMALPARAQSDLSTPDAISLRNQILQLQAQVNQLQAAQNANAQNGDNGSGSALPAPQPVQGAPAAAAAANSDLIADLVTKVSDLQDRVRSLTGQVQDLQNQLQQQQQTFAKQISDINFQLQGGAAAAPAGTAPAGTAPDGTAPAGAAPDGGQSGAPTSLNGGAALPTGTLGTLPVDPNAAAAPATPAAPPPAAAPTSQDILLSGTTALGKKQYSEAEKDAKSVLATDRASVLGYDAQFLLARALAGKHDWQNAAVAYDDTYQRAHFGAHTQDAQLGEAKALMELGDSGAACGALNRLTKQYPNPRADLAPAIAKTKAKACAS